MITVHKLFGRQLAQARAADGTIDLDALGALVSQAYAESDEDRRRTDRSIALMVDELDQLNRHLERLVEERTAALRAREAELKAQNVRFDAALNNMTQALLMFDAEHRLLIANNRYLDMYKLTRDQIPPGSTLEHILECRRAAGTYFEDPKSFTDYLIPALAERKVITRFSELPDGRTMFILIQPLPDGGWISTHQDITERRRAEQQIAYMAQHDFLTNLPNRVLLRERLEQAVPALCEGEQLAVLYLDLDHFKTINDTLGHHFGDELLKAAALRLRSIVKACDTVARMGGDEFVVVQTGIRRMQQTTALAQRICEAMRQPFDLEGHTVVVEVSIGISLAPGDGQAPNDLLKNADIALYRAKAEGRSTFRFFEPDMDTRMKARHELAIALRHALTEGQFELHYQPLVALSDQRVTACEALLRWNHPVRGQIPPDTFIPIAEEIGIIAAIGEWVIGKACADAVRWPHDVKLAVNLSPIQVMNPNLVSVIVRALAVSGLPATRLEIEITESALLHHTDATLAALHRLRSLGVGISMDDFGTGYSSLSSLRSFPFNKIKIDRCFVQSLVDGDDSVAIIEAIAGLAKSLGMITTAEGVETLEQMNRVRALGCTEMQGYLISRPRPLNDLWPLFATECRRTGTAD
ncbi:MAG: EAL domain-containing protein [Pseudorhodoplanes sp.]|nr:EAL domain-containing protein [Pseudorhodoplanes sp.]